MPIQAQTSLSNHMRPIRSQQKTHALSKVRRTSQSFFFYSRCSEASFFLLHCAFFSPVGLSAFSGMIQMRLIRMAPVIRFSLHRIWTWRGVTPHFSAASCTVIYPFTVAPHRRTLLKTHCYHYIRLNEAVKKSVENKCKCTVAHYGGHNDRLCRLCRCGRCSTAGGLYGRPGNSRSCGG